MSNGPTNPVPRLTAVAEDDPFSADADPCPPTRRGIFPSVQQDRPACACDAGAPSFSRRGALTGMTSLMVLAVLAPVRAAALPVLAPCIQTTQKPQACRHKFCRHYGGSEDFHGR
jgi:hypothetical protein